MASGLEKMTPGVIIAGRNAVNVDAVGMAVMRLRSVAGAGHVSVHPRRQTRCIWRKKPASEPGT